MAQKCEARNAHRRLGAYYQLVEEIALRLLLKHLLNKDDNAPHTLSALAFEIYLI